MARKRGKDQRFYQRIGYTILKLRERKGLTLVVLAELAGVHRNTVVNAESGREISASSLFRIATALGVTMESLAVNAQLNVRLGDEDNPRQKKAAKVNCESSKLF